MLKTVGNYLKYALKNKYIEAADLFTTDEAVMAKINKNLEPDSALAGLYEKMNNQLSFVNSPQDFEMSVFLKSRIVDPLFYDGNNIIKLSDRCPGWKQITGQNLKPKKYFLKYKKNPGL